MRHCCRIDREDTGDFADDLSSSDPPGSPTYQCTPSSSQHAIPMRRDQSLHKVDGGVVVESHHPFSRHHHHHLHQNGRHSQHRKNSASGMMIPLITVDSARSTPIATPSTELTGTFSKHSNLTSSTSVTLGGTETPDSSKEPPKLPRKDKDDMYTIVIKLPDSSKDPTAKPSIKMITDSEEDDERNTNEMTALTEGKDQGRDLEDIKDNDDQAEDDSTGSVARRLTQTTDNLRMAMQARVAVKMANRMKTQRARKQRIERKQDRKAAKTLSAILLAFIVTWTPYNIFTVIETFCTENCINETVYAIGKYFPFFLS